jgi:hypothetical protein
MCSEIHISCSHLRVEFCIVETLHINGHHVIYDAHQTIKHDMWGH